MSDLIERLEGVIRWNDIALAREAAQALREERAAKAEWIIKAATKSARIKKLEAVHEAAQCALDQNAISRPERVLVRDALAKLEEQ